MAFWMDQVSRGWLIYELTDSALQLGLVRGIQAIPILLLSPVAGSTADRFSRKKQILLSQIVDGLMYAGLTFLIFTAAIKPWHVYISAFVMAIDQTFLQPARAAIIADAVPRNRLTNAIGLNSMIFNTARSTGPALAGILIAKYGTGGAYATQAIFCALATLWTMQLRSAPQSSANAQNESANEPSFVRSIIEGWIFSWQNAEVRTGLLIVMLVALLIVPFTTLLPIFARDILARRRGRARAALDSHGRRRVGQRRHYRIFRRPHAARDFYARRRGLVRRQRCRICDLTVVSVVHSPDGCHRRCQRVL